MAIISLCLVVGLGATTSSTAIDRIGLYMLPIQLFVFSNLPILLRKRLGGPQPVILGVLCYYALVQWVWLSFAENVWAWVPYDSVLVSTSSRR
jgi:Ca2+/Na+ antiporter